MPLPPPHCALASPDGAPLGQYALDLLASLGIGAGGTAPVGIPHPARRIVESGLSSLIGAREAAPVLCPVPLASCADDALNAFRALTGAQVLPELSGAGLLTERAAITGLGRNGSHSAGGHCRLLRSANGVVGVNLARDADWELVPAWLEGAAATDWPALERCLAEKSTAYLVDRARLLGLAVVDATLIPQRQKGWVDVTGAFRHASPRTGKPRVIDLSSLWAGPLCSRLWQQAGAEVIKVESSQRPDGARFGPPEFFERLNAGKECVSLDLHREAGRRALLALLREADIVLEASRPRALRQMGIRVEELLEERPGLSWVSITGYGRREPQGNWIAYGDDAGIAAGLSALLHDCTGQWLICGDAIADPLTGLHAALAGWASWLAGGGQLVELSLERTVRHCITATAPADNDYRTRYREWEAYLLGHRITAASPPCAPSRGEAQSSPR